MTVFPRASAIVCLLFAACLPAGEGVRDGAVELRQEGVTSLRGRWTLCVSDQSCLLFPVPGGWLPNGLFIREASYRLKVRSAPGKAIGFVMPRVLASYELYWNGKLISLPHTGGEPEDLTKRFFILPDPQEENLLEIKVRGLGEVGGLVQPEVFAGPARDVENLFIARRAWLALLSGAFLFAGISHLLFYFSRPKSFPYLYYSVACALSSLAIFSAEGLTQILVESSRFNTILFSSVVALMPVATGQFAQRFFYGGSNLLVNAITAVGAVFTAFFWSGFYSVDWFVFVVRYFLPASFLFTSAAYGALILLVIRARIERKPGSTILLVGLAVFALTLLNDFAVNRGMLRNVSLSAEGYLFFIGSLAIALARQFALFQKEHDLLHLQLENSERSYRSLVEGSSQMIFALDAGMNIMSMNQAARVLLGYEPKKMRTLPFTELIHSDGLVETYMAGVEQLLSTRKPVRFSTTLTTKFGEPRPVEVEMEYVQSEAGDFILGKASGRQADEIIEMCEEENQYYVMGNYVVLAELLSRRLTAPLERRIGQDAAVALQIGLRELLVNAIEHGNLGISFEEKTALQKEGRYYETLRERQKDPATGGRKVRIWYQLTANSFEVRIKDEGKGFDHRRQMAMGASDVGRLQHGRGLLMARAEFDEIVYNDPGNEVTVRKRF